MGEPTHITVVMPVEWMRTGAPVPPSVLQAWVEAHNRSVQEWLATPDATLIYQYVRLGGDDAPA